MKRTLYIVLALGFLGFLAGNVFGQKSSNAVVFAAPWITYRGAYNTVLHGYTITAAKGEDCGLIIHGLAPIPSKSGPYIPWYVDTVPAWGARREMRAVAFRTLAEAKVAVEGVCK